MPNTKDTAGRLKIGLVLDDSLDKPDGVQQYVLSIGEWLRGQGHDVHYLVGETERRDLEGLHSLSRNLKVRFNRNRMSMPLPTSPKKLREFLINEKFDVIHVQMPYSPFLAHRLILAANRRTAIIGTFHIFAYGKLATTGTKVLGVWMRRSLKRFDAIVSVSAVARDFAKQTFKINSQVLPNVVDYARFAEAKPIAKYQDHKLNILFLGRLVPRKGCLTLLRAINILQRDTTLPAFRVLVCGKGPLADKLRQYSREHHLDNIVEFVGFVSEADKPSYYASADIAVFPSSGGESFGIVLLEAMASGRTAVLAGDNPGYRSVMIDRPELMFDPQSSKILASLIKRYLKHSNLRLEAQKWGQAHSLDYDTAKVGGDLLKIYQQALRNHHQQ